MSLPYAQGRVREESLPGIVSLSAAGPVYNRGPAPVCSRCGVQTRIVRCSESPTT